MLAQNADRHLPITPGTDVVLQNALMHVILQEGLQTRPISMPILLVWRKLRAEVQKYDPVTAAKICGIDEDSIRHVARLFCQCRGGDAMIWTMGINQSTHGSDGVVGDQQPGAADRQYRQARRHQPLHHRTMQCDGHA